MSVCECGHGKKDHKEGIQYVYHGCYWQDALGAYCQCRGFREQMLK